MEMTGDDISKRELDRAFPETYEVESNPGYNAVVENSRSQACCRFCRTGFETIFARRTHDCIKSSENDLCEDSGILPIIQPGVHELGAHLMWDANGLSPYFAIVANFDRVLGTSLYFDLDGETWELNHDEKKIKYWNGKLAAREQDSFSAFNEYQIGVRARDSVGRRYVTFQFRPGLPNATHVDTGKPIGGLPEDCPESIRVQVHSANVDPEEIIDILHALMDAMTIDTAHFRREDIHERSRCYNLALYVRMTRLESEEKIVSRNGLLEQLALISSQQRGRGEYKWDNEEIIGHRTAVTLDERSLGKLLPDQYVGKLLKSYHMKNPTALETDASTTSPKLEVQYSTEYSKPKRQSVPWRSAHEYDLTDLRDELDEYLVNILNWAGVTTRADERIYVSDEYWTVKETERPLQIYENPLENVIQHERDLAVHHLTSAELTNSERRVLETIADGGQKSHHSEIADRSGTSSSTVYRTADKLDGVLRKIHGQIDFEDTIVREKFQQLLSRIDDVVEWAETGVEALAREEGLLTSDSALARWARTYAVDVAPSYDRGAEFDRIEIQGGEFDRYQIIKILRRGYEAARAVGPQTAVRFLDANFVWYEPNNGRVEAVSAFTYYGTSLRVLGTPVGTID